MIEILDSQIDAERLCQLKADPYTNLFDTIYDQLVELIAIQYLGQKTTPTPTEYLGELNKEAYGVWVYYPWSRNLVHLLPEKEFIQVRTNRNNYKITPAEQQKFSEKKIGIIGLSVGKSTAISLTMQRSFGEIRLADFDSLDLSNLNRIVSGVHNLNLKKTSVVAREILEIDPFLKVVCYDEGINADNIGHFLTNAGQLDLLIDECDSLDIKVLGRIEARKLGIPVIMETSDRGMLDVERFDLERNRPIFHGLVGQLDMDELSKLKTNAEKAPHALAIIGIENISKRLKASVIEINESISTWPQLAADVALGGAVLTDTWRRMVAGEFDGSGRFYIDLEQIISSKKILPNRKKLNASTDQDAKTGKKLDAIIQGRQPKPKQGQLILSNAQLDELVSYAIMAPSGGNSQPWKWLYSKGTLFLILDKDNAGSLLDYQFYGSYLALGSAIQNLEIASQQKGYSLDLA